MLTVHARGMPAAASENFSSRQTERKGQQAAVYFLQAEFW